MPAWMLTFAASLVPAVVLVLALVPTLTLTGEMVLAVGAWSGIGAYAFAIAIQRMPPAPALGVALLGAGIAAILTALLCARTRGLPRLVSTAAAALLVSSVLSNADAITGGERGISVTPVLSWSDLQILAAAAISALIGALVVASLDRSALGTRLKALRRMSLLLRLGGHHPFRYRLLAFLISGLLAGMAGVVTTLVRGAITPGLFSLQVAVTSVALLGIAGGLSDRLRVSRLLFITVSVPLLFQLCLRLAPVTSPAAGVAAYHAVLFAALWTLLKRSVPSRA
jgi:branched-chain amino acid transport system permease protein